MSDYRSNEIAMNEFETFIRKNQNKAFLVGVVAEVVSKNLVDDTLTIKKTPTGAEIIGAKIPEYMDISTINVGDRILFLNINNSSQAESFIAFFNYG